MGVGRHRLEAHAASLLGVPFRGRRYTKLKEPLPPRAGQNLLG
jgi:hypothetical protein